MSTLFSKLPQGGALNPSDEVLVNQSNVSKRIPVSAFPPKRLRINPQTVASYTLQTADLTDTLLQMNSASPQIIIIPKVQNLNVDPGTCILIERYGAGTVTVQGEDGTVIIRSATGNLGLRVQYSVGGIIKTGPGNNEWAFTGDIQ